MYQVIEQTDEEKLAMYMKLSKRQLAEMLLNANKINEYLMKKKLIEYHPIEDWKIGTSSNGKEW